MPTCILNSSSFLFTQESITSLDDEEMEVLDSALAAVFHEQKEKALAKKQKKSNDSNY